jgi:vanillate/3-O-methylgallate O-demethylase
LAMVDEAGVREGAQFTVLWASPAGGTDKPVVEHHVQTEIPVTLTTSSPSKATG